jgi:polyisoprenoid-binding protein YceI
VLRPWISLRGAFAAVVVLVSLVPRVGAAAEGSPWRIEHGDLRVVVPLKPGGAFEAKASSVTGTLTLGAAKPPALGGEVSVDLAAIDTGIALRNQHLREKYLEVAKGPGFDKAVLSEIVLRDATGADFQGQTAFTGTLLLHGVKGPLSGTADIRRVGPDVRVEAKFPLTLTDFGVEPPEYLGVGVASKVFVRVTFTATTGRTTPSAP